MRKTFLLLLAGAFFTNIQAQQLKLEKGQKFQLTTSTKTAISQQMMGQSMEMSSNTSLSDEILVDDASAQSIVLKKTTKQLTTSFSGMGQNVDFDSNKPEDMNGPIGTQMKDLLNQPMTFVLNSSGIIADAPKLPGTGVMGSIGDATKGELFSGFIALPSSIKVGDVFSVNGADGDNKTTSTFTVQSLSGKEAVLKINATSNKTNTVNQMGMDMLMTLKITTTGIATVDVTTGFILSATTEMNTDGTISVMGQSVPMTVKTSTTISGKKL